MSSGPLGREKLPAKNKGLEASFGAAADDDEGGGGSQEEEVYGGGKEASGGEESRGGVGEDEEVGQSASREDGSEVEREGRCSNADRAEEGSRFEEEEEEEEEEDAKLQRKGWLPSDDPILPDAESVVEFGYVGTLQRLPLSVTLRVSWTRAPSLPWS